MGRILVVCAQSPYPVIDGARLRTYSTAKILQRDHEVHLLIADRTDANAIETLNKKFSDVSAFDHDSQAHRLRQYGRSSWALFTGDPIRPRYYHFPDVQKWIDNHASEYDLLYANYINTVPYVRSHRYVVDFVDAMSQNYGQLSTVHSPPRSWLYSVESQRLRRYERTVAKDAVHGFVTTERDASDMGIEHDVSILPNGVRDEYLDRATNTDRVNNRIVFLGRMDYYPNVDAVRYFVDEIFPHVRSSNHDASFVIVGSNPSNEVQALDEVPGVSVTGFVDEPAEFLESATVVVAPMRYGTGIQNKVLEAMALGRPVVTTPLGAEGVDSEDGEHLFVSRDSTEFAETVSGLLLDPKTGDEVGMQARKRIANRYTWGSISEKLLGHLDRFGLV